MSFKIIVGAMIFVAVYAAQLFNVFLKILVGGYYNKNGVLLDLIPLYWIVKASQDFLLNGVSNFKWAYSWIKDAIKEALRLPWSD